ncbi:MAG: cyclic-di-AMP receptor [bacterium]
MKMVLAIVSHDDSNKVQKALVNEKFFATKLSSTGGFLSKGNTTFMIGCEDELVEKAIEVISEHCKSRKKIVPNSLVSEYGMFSNQMIEVSVGGATIFVLDVAQFKKI